MNRFKGAKLVFTIIIIQSFLALSFGSLFYYLSTKDKIPANVYLGNEAIGGKNVDAAAKSLETLYGDLLKNGCININSEGLYKIRFSEIDAVLDSRATLRKAFGINGKDIFFRLGGEFLGSRKRSLNPVITVNEGKLRMELEKLSQYINHQPQEADIALKDGKFLRSPEVPGKKLNIDKAVKKVEASLASFTEMPVEFSAADGTISVLPAQITLKELEDAQTVLAKAEIPIDTPELLESITGASKAVNKVLLHAGDMFSFNKYLGDAGIIKNDQDEGYNLVASALYQAALKAGVNNTGINRVHHRSAPQFTQPGLDAVVSGNEYDLKFANSLNHTIIVFASVTPGRLTVSIAGRNEDVPATSVLETRVVQYTKPPLIREENSSLKKGQTRIVDSGKDGLKVEVLLNGKLLVTDSYEAVQAVMQIGPGTAAEDMGGK